LPLIPFTGEKRLNIIGSRVRKVEWQVTYQTPKKSQSESGNKSIRRLENSAISQIIIAQHFAANLVGQISRRTNNRKRITIHAAYCLVQKPMPLFLRREIQPDIPIVDQYSDEMVFA